MASDDCMSGLAQARHVEYASNLDTQLHGVQLYGFITAGTAMEKQPGLKRSQREKVCWFHDLCELIDLPLIDHRRQDVGGSQSSAAVLHVRRNSS